MFVFQDTKNRFRKFALKNAQKISAVLMASKMLSVIAILALLPIDRINTPVQKYYQTTVKLDTASPLVVAAKDRQVAVSTGMANIDIVQAQVAPKVTSDYVSYASVERDPSYFRDVYKRAANAYNIPWQLLEAVHYVETGSSDSTSETSYAGARGPMQFMPGTWRTYGTDGNGDGRADISNVEDAIFGAANLLASSGAAEGNIDGALFNYNHAQWYVNKVKQIAQDAGM